MVLIFGGSFGLLVVLGVDGLRWPLVILDGSCWFLMIFGRSLWFLVVFFGSWFL